MKALPRIYSIQALRAVAAILVVIFHGRNWAYTYQAPTGLAPTVLFDFAFLRDLGAIGVDIFFIISGFVMTYITWHEPRVAGSILPFLQRRLVRIVPTYWLYTLVMAVIMLVMAGHIAQSVDLRAVLWSLSFIPYTPATGNLAPVLAVGWTLSYEVYFYVLIALGLLLPLRFFLIGSGIFFASCVGMGALFPPASPVLALVTSSLILEFYFGMLICAAFLKWGGINKWLGWAALVAGLAALFILDQPNPPFSIRGFVWGIPAVGMVLWFLAHESSRNILAHPVFQALGASSYTLYLTHLIVIPAFGRVMGAVGLTRYMSLDVYLVISVATCLVVGHVLYLFVEQPLTRFASRLFRRKAAATRYA